jgi:hypothetical protein
MATNITTDNLQTADTLESLGAGTESGSFLICGKGSKLYQLPFERLQKNVNNKIVIPTKMESNAALNELFIESEITNIAAKLFNDFSIVVDFSKDGNIVVMNNNAYFIDTNGHAYKVDLSNFTLSALSTNNFMAVINCRDYALFIHKNNFVSASFGINIKTGEVVHAAESVNSELESLLMTGTLRRVQNNNYPIDNYNGVLMFDNASTYTYFYFSCAADGWQVQYKALSYADIEAETGEKQKNVIACILAFYQGGVLVVEDLQFISTNKNIVCLEDESLDEGFSIDSDLLNYAMSYNIIDERPIDAELLIFSKNKIAIYDIKYAICHNKEIFFNDEIKAEIVSVQRYEKNSLFALQKTNSINKYAIVKYELEEYTADGVVLNTSVVKTIATNMGIVQNFVIDPVSMQKYLDGEIIEPSIYLVGQNDTLGTMGIEYYETTYKQSLKIKLADGVKTLTE